MAESLKHKTISGMIWSAVQRFGTLTISFVSNLVLARLLLPDDFGCIGMLMVFIAIAGTFVEGGLDSALIQKKQPTNIDYSTIFYFNLLFSLALYAVLFFSASAIASFYKMGQLDTMLRVMGIIIFISALGIVQNNQLRKQLDFKRIATIEVIAVTVGAIIGIILAFLGFGVWSLIAKTILNSALRSLLLWLLSKWKPLKVFSLASLKELFSFGGLIFLSNITERIASEFVSLLIGRIYSAKDLGFYVQAKNVNQIPERTIPFVINQVFFPVFSSIQDDIEKIVAALKMSLKALTFVNFPLMIILIIIAKPLIIILLTEKWLESVPYFQLLCLGGIVYSVNSNNVNVLMALGQGKHILYLSFIKRGLTLALIIIGIQFGIYGIVCGSITSVYLWVPLNAYYSSKLTGYNIFKQIKDVGPNFLLSISVGCIVFLSFSFIDVDNNYLLILLNLLSYSVLYLLFAYLFKIEEINILLNTAKIYLKNDR